MDDEKKVIKTIGFVIVLILALQYTNGIFKFKYYDGIYSMEKLYEEPKDSIDVLFLGSSHAFTSFNTGVLWEQYGMASYVLAGPGQPLWNTYYYLLDALKSQKPKLIVLEGYLTASDDEYSDEVKMMKNLFGMRFSTNKIRAFLESVPDGKKRDYFLEYIQYHNRYEKLSIEDFYKDQGTKFFYDWKGFVGLKRFTSIERENVKNVSGVKEYEELYEKEEKYYRLILETAQKSEIPVLVVVAPFAAISEYEQKKYNRAEQIAQEYRAGFVNFNLMTDKIGLDFSADVADKGHMNLDGSVKFSDYLGKIINDNYTIPNRKGDPAYDSWKRNAEFLREEVVVYDLLKSNDIHLITEKLNNKNFLTFISLNGKCDAGDDRIRELTEYFEISDCNNGLWVIDKNGVHDVSEMEEHRFYKTDDINDLFASCTYEKNGNFISNVYINRKSYQKVKNGLNIVVFDLTNGYVADQIGLDAEKEYALVR